MSDVEVSVVMPCLNEARTLRVCVEKAHAGLAAHGVAHEIVIGDNGSTDGSQAIAAEAGARVVDVPVKGYGGALMGGIQAARGRFVIMGDSDASYDFSDLMPFVEKLRAGNQLVMGNRFAGGIRPGAMPPLHKYLGNPGFTLLGRVFFKSPFGDFYCGLRGFERTAILGLQLRTTGMEFAIEMVAKSTLYGLRLAEVPTTLSPDGRDRRPHLRTWRDGWRTLRFLLLYSPRWLFLVPGLLLILFGLAGYLVSYPQWGFSIGGHVVRFDVSTMLVSSLFILIGFQAILFAIFTKSFAIEEGLLPPDPKMDALWRVINLERGLLVSLAVTIVGIALIAYAFNDWRLHAFGPLDPDRTLRLVIPGSTLVAMGVQAGLASFFLSILGLPPPMKDAAELFDDFAADYEAALQQGLATTGDDAAFYARGRVDWMQRRLDALGLVPRRVLDFGCGTGGSAPFLLNLRGVEEIIGVDVSAASLDVARSRHAGPRVRFASVEGFSETAGVDLAFCNGVFHHIAPADRAECVAYVRRTLRPGGLFALWENNPWNPGVRYVMRKVSFDRDAVTLSPPETRRLLRAGGFEVVGTDFRFVFPRPLRWLRGLETPLRKVPLGGQYLTLGRPTA